MALRSVRVALWVHTYSVDGECPTCRFDALIRFVAYIPSPNGVTTASDKTYCGRCENERRRND